MQSAELLFAAQVLARPEYLTSLAIDLRTLTNATARTVVRILQTQGEAYAAPALLMAALADCPEQVDPAEVEYVLLAIPSPDEVTLEGLLEAKGRLETAAGEQSFARQLQRVAELVGGGQLSATDAAPQLRGAIERVLQGAVDRDHTAAGVLSRLRNHTPAVRWRCGSADLDGAFPGIGPDGAPGEGLLGQGEIVLLAARYGVGKSRLALNWIASLLDQGASVALMVLEDNEAAYALKLMGARFDIRKWQLERYILGGEGWLGSSDPNLRRRCDEATAWFDSVGKRLRIYDGGTKANVFKISTAIETLRQDALLHGATHAVLDYVQMWTGETAQLESNAFELRAFAARHNVGLLEISQFSNDTIKWGSHPGAVAAKGSGAWAQAAHVGIEIEDDPAIGQVELLLKLKKGRDSARFSTVARFNPDTGRVLEYYGTPKLMQLDAPAPTSAPKRAQRKGG